MFSPEGAAARLGEGLDRIHLLLRDGQLAEVAAATAELEGDLAIFRAAAGRLAAGDLEMLRRKSERNAACLQGAARGIRAAHRRLAEVRKAATGHAAYDVNGQRVEGPAGNPRLARRF